MFLHETFVFLLDVQKIITYFPKIAPKLLYTWPFAVRISFIAELPEERPHKPATARCPMYIIKTDRQSYSRKKKLIKILATSTGGGYLRLSGSILKV